MDNLHGNHSQVADAEDSREFVLCSSRGSVNVTQRGELADAFGNALPAIGWQTRDHFAKTTGHRSVPAFCVKVGKVLIRAPIRGEDTISRIERRSDLLISTLRRYVEAMGGSLQLVARFPDRPDVLIERLSEPGNGAIRHAIDVHEKKASYRVKRGPAAPRQKRRRAGN